ncbi:Adenylosuccinate synthetase [Aphelenchoides fujianensis]|nr:Adenylosuccinate synthetase [Aphelenchoides fujianensis]
MSVTVILGAQWGDEGKGKVIDFLINNEQVDVTARCQGGNNAGHTVKANGKTYDFHILPSGIISNNCLNVIGNGVVVNLDSFFSELEHNGVTTEFPGWEKRIFISDRAHVVFQVHQQVDGMQDSSLDSKSKIGTTNKGIGPTYSSKCFRNGVRMADLMGDFDEFAKRYSALVAHYKRHFTSVQIDEEAELQKFKVSSRSSPILVQRIVQNHADRLKSLGLVVNTASLLYKLRQEGKNILVEGANGVLLDIDFGTYPYVTSSNASVGGACTGLGIPPSSIKRVLGIVKAYQTRVGSGPFPTEQHDKVGEDLQRVGHEFGVTTGRKRRCGWLDLFLLRNAQMANGFTEFALTKLDILDGFAEIKVAVAYKLNGQQLENPPARAADWELIEVEYKTFPGWQSDTSGIRQYEALPEACRNYIAFIEHFVGVPVKYVGVGQAREALIKLRELCAKNADVAYANEKAVLITYEPRHVPRYHEWMENAETREMTCSERMTLDEEHETRTSWAKHEYCGTFLIMDAAEFVRTDGSELDSLVGDVNFVQYADYVELLIMIGDTKFRRRGLAQAAVEMMIGHVCSFLGSRRDSSEHPAQEHRLHSAAGADRIRASGGRRRSSRRGRDHDPQGGRQAAARRRREDPSLPRRGVDPPAGRAKSEVQRAIRLCEWCGRSGGLQK